MWVVSVTKIIVNDEGCTAETVRYSLKLAFRKKICDNSNTVKYRRPDCLLDYICNEFLLELNCTMFGVSGAVEELNSSKGSLAQYDVGNVSDELKTFGKEGKYFTTHYVRTLSNVELALPKFLVDQMERDTTRYVNLTTIATFFSSVTATTLQFTYAETDAVPSNSLRGVVNLFWFLSLVFSVSSGVSSLLGLTWRKSSMCVTSFIFIHQKLLN